MTMHFESAGRTDVGKVRRRNEDAILVRDDAGLWVVADGLGGHAAGDYASGLIVERLARVPRDGGVSDFVESIEDALGEVNDALRRAAGARGVDLIASTVVLLVHAIDYMLCGWVGDSRAYGGGEAAFAQLTRDHVYVAEDGAAPAAGSGVLTRAVGAEHGLAVDWLVAGNQPGSTFLLCSDGLNKELTDAEIAAACRRRASPSAVLDEMFKLALGRAARDNVSAVVVRTRDGTPANERLAEVNRDLRTLNEACRLGNVARGDYRARRRQLFDALFGSGAEQPAARDAARRVRRSRWSAWAHGWFRRG